MFALAILSFLATNGFWPSVPLSVRFVTAALFGVLQVRVDLRLAGIPELLFEMRCPQLPSLTGRFTPLLPVTVPKETSVSVASTAFAPVFVFSPDALVAGVVPSAASLLPSESYRRASRRSFPSSQIAHCFFGHTTVGQVSRWAGVPLPPSTSVIFSFSLAARSRYRRSRCCT